MAASSSHEKKKKKRGVSTREVPKWDREHEILDFSFFFLFFFPFFPWGAFLWFLVGFTVGDTPPVW